MNEIHARVISQEKGLYKIQYGTEIKSAAVSGRFRYEAMTVSDYPAVGDYVAADWSDENSNAVITELLYQKIGRSGKAGAGSCREYRHCVHLYVAQQQLQSEETREISSNHI